MKKSLCILFALAALCAVANEPIHWSVGGWDDTGAPFSTRADGRPRRDSLVSKMEQGEFQKCHWRAMQNGMACGKIRIVLKHQKG